MKTNDVTLTNLQELLDFEASKFTAAEVHLKNTLPEWINKTSNVKLKGVLEKYLDLIEEHVQKLEDFFKDEHILAVSMNNKVLNALAEDTDEKLELCTDPDLKDACLLSSIQGINHFKISAYGTAAAFSNTLGLPKYGGIFHEIEVNEKQIDDRLSQLAEHEINMKAKAPHLLPKDQQYSKGFDLP